MERSDFVVFFDQIPEEGISRRLAVSGEDLGLFDLSVSLGGTLEAEVNLMRLGRRILIRGSVAGTMDLECSRCLGTFPFPFDAAFETYLETAGKGKAEAEKELSREDLDVQSLRDGSVDLRDIIAEQVHLAVPYKALCGEACRGLCSRCGVDLNSGDCSCEEAGSDPRWDALRGLKVR
jgi:uncharacterized protein